MARHEFRFVIDGVDLEPEHVAAIAQAVQQAGAGAAASVGLQPALSIDVYGRFGPGWIGRILMAELDREQQELAGKLAGGLVDISAVEREAVKR